MAGVRVVVPAKYERDAPPVLRGSQQVRERRPFRRQVRPVDLLCRRFSRNQDAYGPDHVLRLQLRRRGVQGSTDCQIVFEDNCNLQRAVFEDSDLSESSMDGCRLDEAGFSEVNLASLQNARLLS